MATRITHHQEAFEVLGLPKGASLEEAKRAFRGLVKRLHPDRTPATPETLRQLADAIAAIRLIESSEPPLIELAITLMEARSGGSRTITHNRKTLLFRFPAGSEERDTVEAIGDPGILARLVIQPEDQNPEVSPEEDQLARFIQNYVDQSPNSRFAGWVRKARSAA